MEYQNQFLPQTILLAGNPNSGKTTVFNLLTGLKHHTANYPGVTVESKSGHIKILNHDKEFTQIPIIDLPGIYSLDAVSLDEKVAVDAFQSWESKKENSLLFYVIDSTNFPRSLKLLLQLKKAGFHIVVLLNMYDLAQKADVQIDAQKLSSLIQSPVICIENRTRAVANEIKKYIRDFQAIKQWKQPNFDELTEEEIIQNSFTKSIVRWNDFLQKADRFLLHPILGPLIFFALMAIIFQSIFSWSEIPMLAIEEAMAFISQFLANILPEGKLNDLVVNGVLAGITGILIFIPQIAFLFFFIALMDESGYLARVSFLFDSFMQKFGLNGRSMIALIGGAACAVPSVLSTRTIANKKERLLTIFVTPFMSCSARLPVYTVLIALVVPDEKFFIFHAKGLVLFALYMLGIVAAFASAFILSIFIKSEQKSFLIIELPYYKKPQALQIFSVVIHKVKGFIFNAGKIILAISIVLWFLVSYGPPKRLDRIENSFATIELTEEESARKNALLLENSYAGIVGKAIEPVIAPLGFDWKIGIALITSFAAREVFVGTMSTIYSVGAENEALLSQKLKEQKRPDGSPMFTLGVSSALMLFYAFAMQCMSTIAVVKKESDSWKIPLAQFLYMGALAWISAWLAFNFL